MSEAKFTHGIEIPDFLIEMSKQINDQDNRCTADPIWQVRCKRYLVTEAGHNEHHWEIVKEDEGSSVYNSEEDHDYSDFLDFASEYYPEWLVEWADCYGCLEVELSDGEISDNDLEPLLDSLNSYFEPEYQDLPEGLKVFHMQEIEEVVKTCLTEADAKWFIQRKQHDYPKLYMYVASMVFCPQMIELRNWIAGLTKARGES